MSVGEVGTESDSSFSSSSSSSLSRSHSSTGAPSSAAGCSCSSVVCVGRGEMPSSLMLVHSSFKSLGATR